MQPRIITYNKIHKLEVTSYFVQSWNYKPSWNLNHKSLGYEFTYPKPKNQ